MAAEETSVVTVTASDGEPKAVEGSFADPRTPLVGFSMIEANGVDEVVQLVAGTPYARAKGAIEIRPILSINDGRLIHADRIGALTGDLRPTRSLCSMFPSEVVSVDPTAVSERFFYLFVGHLEKGKSSLPNRGRMSYAH